MTAPAMSPEIVDWAHKAGYALTPEDDSGAAVFWTDPGGEMRFFIRHSPSGEFTISSVERASEEQFELSARSMETVEKYLWGLFGSDLRVMRRLPRLKTPRKEHEIAPGYTLSELDANGFRTLSDMRGPVATARGKLSSITRLTKLSHLLAASVADIQSSFEELDGLPLFHV
jgi:hypothetical protein